MIAHRNNTGRSLGCVSPHITATGSPLEVGGHKGTIVYRRLSLAAVWGVGIVTDNKNILFGLKINIGGDLATIHQNEIIISEKWMVGNAGRPDDGVAAHRLAIDHQRVGGLAGYSLAKMQLDAQTAQAPANGLRGTFGHAW